MKVTEIKQIDYIAPEYHKQAFHCPRCNVYAKQIWKSVYTRNIVVGDSNTVVGLEIAFCSHCKKMSLWAGRKLVEPKNITAPLAHKDMPESVLEYYNEAREISTSSPRAAAALLRIAAKKLCESLGENESNLNLAIGNLSKKGLPQNVINSLDTVRIVGNEGGAHEGLIDLTGEDNKEIVDRLFWLINFIIEKTIAEPNEIKNVFNSLPESKRKAAEKRDEEK